MEKYWAIPYISGNQKVKSPLRYPGGKFYALKHIMPYIECVDHDEYREPFLGGGSVFFAKTKVKYNILNDLEFEIINFYKAILDDEMKLNVHMDSIPHLQSQPYLSAPKTLLHEGILQEQRD